MAITTARVTWQPMNLWRLEWLRLKRTPRALTMAAVFVFFGLLQPILARYQSQLFSHVGNGVRISFPPATPAAGVSGYFGELAGTGLIVVVVIAAGAFTFDAHHGLAIFLRTRVTGFWRLIAPRFTVNAGAAGLAFVLGALAAWYETWLLIGAPAVGGMLAAMLCGVVYLGYAVAVTAFAATLVRGPLGTVGIALAVLFALPIAGIYRPYRRLAAQRPDQRTGRAAQRHAPPFALPAGVRGDSRGGRGSAGRGRATAAGQGIF